MLGTVLWLEDSTSVLVHTHPKESGYLTQCFGSAWIRTQSEIRTAFDMEIRIQQGQNNCVVRSQNESNFTAAKSKIGIKESLFDFFLYF